MTTVATVSRQEPRKAVQPDSPDRFARVAFLAWWLVAVGWWTFALAPIGEEVEWMERARAVCFGSVPGGLPDTWGWMVLVLSPLSLLALLVAVWGGELRAWLRSLGMAGRAVIAVLLLLPAGLCAGWIERRAEAVARAVSGTTALAAPEGSSLPDHWPRTYEKAPVFELVDQQGERYSNREPSGRPQLLTFVYAHCATVCPVLVYAVREATERLEGRAEPVFITLDPWRDTPSRLPTLAVAWGVAELPGARLLSGPPEEVVQVQKQFGLEIVRDEQTGEITHPGLVWVLDREGRIAYRFLNPPASWLVDAVTRLEREAG